MMPEKVVELLLAPMTRALAPAVIADTVPPPASEPIVSVVLLSENRPLVVTAVASGITPMPSTWRVAPELTTMLPTKSLAVLASVVRAPVKVSVPTLPVIRPE